VIIFRPEAARELAADVQYYDERYAGRGQRFAAAVERTLALINEFPLAFPALYQPDIRSAKVARFPYRVVYVVVGSNIDVLAVAHAKRRPAYWRARTR
jgi:toxin ParE1/3/4